MPFATGRGLIMGVGEAAQIAHPKSHWETPEGPINEAPKVVPGRHHSNLTFQLHQETMTCNHWSASKHFILHALPSRNQLSSKVPPFHGSPFECSYA